MLLIYFILCILGLVFGSFVSAVTWRIPKKMSFVKGRSICPKCRSNIAWFDNIPLFSYLTLGGKCRKCGKKISIRYPIIELITSIGFILIYKAELPLSYDPSSLVKLIFLFVFFIILEIIFIIDLENKIIPDSLVYSGIFLTLIYLVLINSQSMLSNIFTGFLSASLLLLIFLFTKGKGMGLGDVKFAVFGGMLVGLNNLPFWFFSSFLTGGIIGSILILFGKAKMKTKVPFGPFLIFGILLSLLFGGKFMDLIGIV